MISSIACDIYIYNSLAPEFQGTGVSDRLGSGDE